MRKLWVILATLAALTAFSGCASMVQTGGEPEEAETPQREETSEPRTTPEKTERKEATPEKTQREEKEKTAEEEREPVARIPDDPTLGLSIPKLGKSFENIPTERGDDIQALTDNAAVHLLYTGFPWEDVANVYFAGHVEGYAGTPSYNAFAGLETLVSGDEIIVTDANGKEYTYRVFEMVQVAPTAVEYLDPIPGKNIVTLQTCEIVNFLPDGTPDYSNTDRLVVRGELVEA